MSLVGQNLDQALFVDHGTEFRFGDRAEMRLQDQQSLERNAVGDSVFLSGPGPEWNETALRMCLQGMVVLRATVLRDGTVQEVEEVLGLPFGATQDAVRAVEQWRFEPAVLHGEPVDVYHYLTVKFSRWGER